MKRGVILSILILMLALPFTSAGFMGKWFTGNVVEAPQEVSCTPDDILFLRHNDPQIFDGKSVTLVQVTPEKITLEVDGIVGSIPNFGQKTINGIMMILGDVFKREDPLNILALVKVRSTINPCQTSQPPGIQRTRQCTAQFSGTRGESTLVGGKNVRIIDLYSNGALLDIDGMPARVSNNQYLTVNDVSIVIYKNNIETAEMFMANEYCCSLGISQAMGEATRVSALLQPKRTATPTQETTGAIKQAGFLSSFRNIFI